MLLTPPFGQFSKSWVLNLLPNPGVPTLWFLKACYYLAYIIIKHEVAVNLTQEIVGSIGA